jgi:hypothetical protein
MKTASERPALLTTGVDSSLSTNMSADGRCACGPGQRDGRGAARTGRVLSSGVRGTDAIRAPFDSFTLLR